jgi:hypothetical protein
MKFREFFERRKMRKSANDNAESSEAAVGLFSLKPSHPRKQKKKKKKVKRRCRKDKSMAEVDEYAPPSAEAFPAPETEPVAAAANQKRAKSRILETEDNRDQTLAKETDAAPLSSKAKPEEDTINYNILEPSCKVKWKIRSLKGRYNGPALGGRIPHGVGTIRFLNGAVYEGPFLNGKLHGNMASYTSTSGAIYNGEFENNMKHGYGEEIFKSGRRYVGRYERGHPHGFGIQYFPSGAVLHAGDWECGKPVAMPLTVKVMDMTSMSVEITLTSDITIDDRECSTSEPVKLPRYALDGSASTGSVSNSSESEEEGSTSIYDDGGSSMNSSNGSLFSKSSWRSSNFDVSEEKKFPIATDDIDENIASGTFHVRMPPESRTQQAQKQYDMPPLAADILTVGRKSNYAREQMSAYEYA